MQQRATIAKNSDLHSERLRPIESYVKEFHPYR